MFGDLAYSQEAVFSRFRRQFDLRGASVLEIGGALPAPLVRAAGAASWLAIDPRNREVREPGYTTLRGTGATTSRAPNAFDFTFSSNALEHVHDLPATLERVHADLRPGGCFYCHFGPIWSGPDGHHLEVAIDGIEYNAWSGGIVPHWAHLALTEQELEHVLTQQQPSHIARQLAEWIFQSDELNRLFYEEYLAHFTSCGLVLCHLETSSWVDYAYRASTANEVERLHQQARSRHPHRDLETREVLAILRKPL